MIDSAFLSYNAGRLREICKVFTSKMLEPDCTVGLTISGALTPAGLGMSCLVPLIRAGRPLDTGRLADPAVPLADL